VGDDGLATWLVMRLGHSGEPPRSLRRPVEDMLVTADRVEQGVR
jgi:hypothetical protein